MANSPHEEIKRLNDEMDALKATEKAQWEQITKLDAERQVLQDMAKPPQQAFNESTGQESGPAPAQRDPVMAAMAQERLEKVTNQFADAKTAYGQTQEAIADTDIKLEDAREKRDTENRIQEYDDKVSDLGGSIENSSDTIEAANQIDAVTHGGAFHDAFHAL